jgi:hypothetical protein
MKVYLYRYDLEQKIWQPSDKHLELEVIPNIGEKVSLRILGDNKIQRVHDIVHLIDNVGIHYINLYLGDSIWPD